MKITIAQGPFFPVPPILGGAVEKVWFGLGKEFIRAGHEVTHISRRHDELPLTETIEGVKHIRVSGFSSPKSVLAMKVLDLLYTLQVLWILPKADILVTNTFWLPLLASSARFGNMYVHVARYPKGQMRWYRKAARLQTVSSAVHLAILDEVPELAKRIVTIPYPLPEHLAAASMAVGRDTSRQPTILYAGRVHPEKGIHLLVKAFGKLLGNALQQNLKLQIVGPWDVSHGGGGQPYLDQILTLIKPFAAQVELIGPIFDDLKLVEFYRAASLFVYPSLAERGETFGLAPLEAMAQRCPVLVSDLACFRDFIQEGLNGYFFNHRDSFPVETLAKRLTEVLSNRAVLEQVGDQAYRTASKYTMPDIAAQYLADFQLLLP